MERQSKIRGVLLDIDGTLLDSNDAHALTWKQAIEHYGFSVLFDDVRRMIGMGGDKLLPSLVGITEESELGHKISQERGKLYRENYLPGLKPFRGVRDLLKKMTDSGLKLVVATSASQKDLKPMLEKLGIRDLLEDKTTKDDADSSKPDPDIILAALQKIGLPPSEVLLLGDTPYDIEAAQKAGVGTVAVLSGGWKPEELGAAIAIYRDVEDIVENFDSSPFSVRGSTWSNARDFGAHVPMAK